MKIEFKTLPTREQIRDFPGMVALQVVYENFAYDCTRCGLKDTRKQVVFGTGNSESPPIAFLGEAPGADEDEQGFPFIGAAGQLLTKMLDAMGLKREDVYILNSVSCRPPGNRNPSKDEMKACWPIMASQLKAVRPQTIVCLGAVAAFQLLGTTESVGDLRKRWCEWDGVPVRVTYHPAYLLRNPSMKKRTWTDMKEVLAKVGLEPKVKS